jgi:carbamoyl-phosphate synthase large subunit
MPKREDLEKILIIGSGPIIIGQACEFDYSGTQACKALKEEGYKVILVNSNPATIMTDPDMATTTYIEPLTPEMLTQIIQKEQPDAILPTLGGQTGLNLTTILSEQGVLEKYQVEIIGASLEAIKKAEDRLLFKKAMNKIGLALPRSMYVQSLSEATEALQKFTLPVIIRPSFTLGGTGGGIAFSEEEFKKIVTQGLEASIVRKVLIEESVIGWKEYELEVMRDKADNVVIICSIENVDPMGIHTGDSITVAPAQTLSDREYQLMRDAAIKIIREIGVDTGGSNIQFAVNPQTGEMLVIEMNPRVSRSSALASKATGFPIAKIAAKLAVGYTLDEIPNDITAETPASFEPVIDYVVVKIPQFQFEKFPEAESSLGTQMKSVGEVMAIGRTFKEALQKGIRSLEIGRAGLGADGKDEIILEKIEEKLSLPNPERLFYLKYALESGFSISRLSELTKIDQWFIGNIKEIVELEKKIKEAKELTPALIREAKQYGFSDSQIAYLKGQTEAEVRKLRLNYGIESTFKLVDTCSAEFEAYTPYFYSTYEVEDESRVTSRKKIMILGSGPNRIGQGIEFDYCCVHAVLALKEIGYETIMVNSNPETVSTDYDTSDKLYFEPLTVENVLNIVDKEKPSGVIVQFGGQTPLKIALALERAGVPIIGTSPDAIDTAEDRARFKEILTTLKIAQPPSGIAFSFEEARAIAQQLKYPVLVRPSYVLGGRAMEIIYDEQLLQQYISRAARVSPEHPILIDKFLEDAVEVDVDAVADGEQVEIAGIMQHIEEAGIHSGDSACSIPPFSLSPAEIKEIEEITWKLALKLKVCGLINIQCAIKNGQVYVLEVNPRASRTVPFVSKATGVPWAKIAALLIVGKKIPEVLPKRKKENTHIAIKEVVFPFIKFPGVDVILGPEMKSTGEVMGIDKDLGRAFAKAQFAAGQKLPSQGNVLITVADKDKKNVVVIAKRFSELGFSLLATRGTGQFLSQHGVKMKIINKIQEGTPNVETYIKERKVNLVINTPAGKGARTAEYLIRRAALEYNIPYVTTLSAAQATLKAIEAIQSGKFTVKSLQEYHKR